VLRRAVLKLARRHAFARPLVNTGRMSVANDYPTSPWLPQGSRTVQNLTLQDAQGQSQSLMDLLRQGTRFVGLWFAPPPDEAQRACRELAALPVDLYAIGHSEVMPVKQDPEGVLARHLGLDPAACAGTLCLVRPDAYLAATIPACTAAHLQQRLQTALFAHTTP
jgi:3-(3-hydroxy-phenyl)propionate hydroxylase